MRKRSRFESLPATVQIQGNGSGFERVFRHARIIQKRAISQGEFTPTYDLSTKLNFVRTFGLHNYEDSAFFAVITGRLAFLQRAFRVFLDRRRRQAYLLLRRVLPIELTRAILND